MSEYLKDIGIKIDRAKRTDTPQWGMTVYGYTELRGGPTSIMIMLSSGPRVWRRLKVWQFSNCGTLFVTYKRKNYIVNDYELPDIEEKEVTQ